MQTLLDVFAGLLAVVVLLQIHGAPSPAARPRRARVRLTLHR